MATGYGQECPIGRALGVIGEKWSLLVLRDLLRKGPLRFQELEAGLEGRRTEHVVRSAQDA
jgi:DNA-binding HxlR family transcriptional regulator